MLKEFQSNRLLMRFGYKKLNLYFVRLIMCLMLIGLAFVFLYPFIYMLMTSFKSFNDIMNPIIKWIPREFSPSNYITAYEALNFKRAIWNSIMVAGLATIGHLISCSLAAYGFARYDFKGKTLLFFIVIFSIIVPIQTISVPIYMIYSKLGWVGTYYPLIVPTFIGAGLKGALYIFIFRQFFLRLPKSLEEASFIDGCNEYNTFLRIIVPSAKTSYLVCFVLSVVWHWNDYFEPGIYITSSNDFLLPQMLPSMYNLFNELLFSGTQDKLELALKYHEGVVMAGTVICTVPLLIVYFFFQGKFMQGIERTGLVE